MHFDILAYLCEALEADMVLVLCIAASAFFQCIID